MSTLTGTKVKDTYTSLLKVSDGNITATAKRIEDGAANGSALHLSTSAVGVDSLFFNTLPQLSTTITDVLVIDTTTGDTEYRALGAGAFVAQANVIAGSDITVTGTYPNFTVNNSAPDQTVAITAGTGALTITGTYPNFTIDFSGRINDLTDATTTTPADGDILIYDSTAAQWENVPQPSPALEETFTGYNSTVYTLTTTPVTIQFALANNTTENSSYHFGNLPAKLELAPTQDYITNTSGAQQVIYVDISAGLEVTQQGDTVYTMDRYTGGAWGTVQTVTRNHAAGDHIDSFWGMFILEDGESLRVQLAQSSGGANYKNSLIRFVVREKGNII